jgi:hypothetical protein
VLVHRIDNDNNGAVHWKLGAVAAPSRRKAPPDSTPRHGDSARKAAHDDGRRCVWQRGEGPEVCSDSLAYRGLQLRSTPPHCQTSQAMAPSLASQTLSTGSLSPSIRPAPRTQATGHSSATFAHWRGRVTVLHALHDAAVPLNRCGSAGTPNKAPASAPRQRHCPLAQIGPLSYRRLTLTRPPGPCT